MLKDKFEYQWMIGSDGKVIQFFDRGELVLFDADAREGYRELARAKVTDFTWSQPSLCRGMLFIRTRTQVVCLDLATSPATPETIAETGKAEKK